MKHKEQRNRESRICRRWLCWRHELENRNYYGSPRKRSFFDAPFFVIIWHHKANVVVARYTEQWATALKLLPMMLYDYGEAVLKLRQDRGLTDTLEIAIFSINITMVSCTMTAKEKICRDTSNNGVVELH